MNKNKRKQVFDVGKTLPAKDLRPTAPVDLRGERPIQQPPQTWSWKRYVVSAMLVLAAVLIFIASWDFVSISRAVNKTFGSGNVLSLLSPSSLKGSDSGRVNVLLVGYSVDDPGHPGANLTDSIIILSLSTTSHAGYMLSIPRDLYVKIPGYGYGKINEAYKDGGMPLLEQIVSSNFGQPINYYTLINYAAVRDTVNALGGISVNIQSPDPRGLYDPNISTADGGPLKLANGWQRLDGQTALNFTRARGDPAPDGRLPYGFPRSDFDRSQHQRQVLDAIKQKLGWKIILNPLQNGKIFSAIGNNIKTDVSASEARPLFGLFHSVPSTSLQSLSLNNLNGKNYLSSYTTDNGESALIPAAGLGDYNQIDTAITQLNQ